MPLKNFISKHTTQVKEKVEGFRFQDIITLTAVITAATVLLVVLVSYVSAATTKLSSYKTPIPLSEKEYTKGEIIKGYFIGEKIYNGKVVISRQLSCSDGYADTLPNLKDGKQYVESVLPARKLDGKSPRDIAAVPDDVKVGTSCFVVFNHTACISYLFGCYNAEYSYVSLPFTVIDRPPQSQPSEGVPSGDELPTEDGINTPVINGSTGATNSTDQRVATNDVTNVEETTNGNGMVNGGTTTPEDGAAPPGGLVGTVRQLLNDLSQTVNNLIGINR